MVKNNWTNLLKSICSIAILMVIVSCASLPQKEYGSEAERLYNEGIFYLQHANGFNDYYQRALKLFEEIIEKYKGSKYEPLARIGKADTLFKEGKYKEAAIPYDEFITLFPFQYPEVLKAKYMLAMCYYNLSESFDRDQHYTTLAYNSFGEFLQICSRNPQREMKYCTDYSGDAREKLKEMENKLAHRIYYIAEFYLKRNYRLAAISRLKTLINTFPDSQYTERARSLLKQLERELWQ